MGSILRSKKEKNWKCVNEEFNNVQIEKYKFKEKYNILSKSSLENNDPLNMYSWDG